MITRQELEEVYNVTDRVWRNGDVADEERSRQINAIQESIRKISSEMSETWAREALKDIDTSRQYNAFTQIITGEDTKKAGAYVISKEVKERLLFPGLQRGLDVTNPETAIPGILQTITIDPVALTATILPTD